MPSLRLRSATDTLPLDGITNFDRGIEAQPGVTGLGLAPVQTHWSEWNGNGSRYRGKRYLARDIDLPIYFDGGDREGLRSLVSRLATMLDRSDVQLIWTDDRNEEWYAAVQRVGGGEWSYGVDTTGDRELQTVLTLRAGQPFFESTRLRTHTVTPTAGAGLLKSSPLTRLSVSSSQTFGTIEFDNPGDAPSPGLWDIKGPGTNLLLQSPAGRWWRWNATLQAGQSLRVDMATGTAYNNTSDLYIAVDPRSEVWDIPGGKSVGIASMDGVAAGQTEITVTYRPRRRVLI